MSTTAHAVPGASPGATTEQTWAYPLLIALLAVSLGVSGAPAPLYGLYAERWGLMGRDRATIVAGVNEAGLGAVVSGGWKVWYYIMAVIFILAGIWSLIDPIDTFFALASVLGLVLIFYGSFEIIRSVASRGTPTAANPCSWSAPRTRISAASGRCSRRWGRRSITAARRAPASAPSW